MTNIVHPDSKLSRVTIGALEDMGYTVDYSAADTFGRANLGSDCVCGNRRPMVRHLTDWADDSTTATTRSSGGDNAEVLPTAPAPRRQLSEAGLEDATAKGRAFLKTLSVPTGGGGDGAGGAGESEMEYVGDRSVFVFYMEGGDAYSVYVTPE